MDFEGTYRLPLSRFGLQNWGSLNFDFNGTYLASLVTEAGARRRQDRLRRPLWRYLRHAEPPLAPQVPHHLEHPVVRLAVLGAMALLRLVFRTDAASANPLLSQPANVFPVDEKLGAQNYIDLTMTFKIKDNYQFRIGVDNVFDKEPPLVGAANCPGVVCNANTFPQVYDSEGRYIFMGITATY